MTATLQSALALDKVHLPPIVIPRDRLYHIGQPFLGWMDRLDLSFEERRLVHAVVHATCRQTSEWHGASRPQPVHGHRARLRDLRSAVGLQASRSNRSIHAALETLPESGLFDFLRVPEAAPRWLEWRLTDMAHEALLDGYHYGHYDIATSRACRSALDQILHDHIGGVRRMRQPDLTVFVSTVARSLGREPLWSAVSSQVTVSLRRLAAAWGIGLAVLALETGTMAGIDVLRVRLVHADTQWHNGSPEVMDTRTRAVTLIAPDGRLVRLRASTTDGIASAALGAFLKRQGIVQEG